MKVKVGYRVSWSDDVLCFKEYEEAVQCAERKVAENLLPVKLERIQFNELKIWEKPENLLDK